MNNARRSLSLLALTVMLPLACGPAVELPQDASTTDAEGSTDTPATSSAPGSTSGTNPTAPPDPPQTSTDPYEPTTGSGEGTNSDTDDGCAFLNDCGKDTGTPIECDILEQNCLEGEKCAPWANDGGNSWNATRCVPVADNADLPGEPCTVEGSGVSGLDSCALGSMCWNVNPGTLEGQCIAQCTGTWDEPTCADPTEICQISSEGVLNLCHPSCDPVTQTDCAEGQGCYPVSDAFVCTADASGGDGGLFDQCDFVNSCDPGTACVATTLSEACLQGSAGCCLPFCDVNTPDCPGELVCSPWFEEGSEPPGSEFVGLCVDGSAAP